MKKPQNLCPQKVFYAKRCWGTGCEDFFCRKNYWHIERGYWFIPPGIFCL